MNSHASPPGDPSPRSRPPYGRASLLCFGLALLLFGLTSTAFDARLGHLSLTTQRWLAVSSVVLPAAVGSISGLLGVVRGDRAKGWAVLGLVLNTLFAFFIVAVLAIAG